jgi:hypothetical protein
VPTSEYKPTVQDIANLLPARTVGTRNNRVGTFTPDNHNPPEERTTPSAGRVEALITEATDEIAGLIGPDVPDGPDTDDPDTLRRMAKTAVSLLGAMNVELTEFPEQIGTNRSPYPQLEKRLANLMKNLEAGIEAVGGQVPDPDVDDTGVGGSRFPSYGFPADAGGMISWGTQF